MKNFKLFLFGGVFCSLIVSTAVAVARTCADKMPTCEELGYKWNCSTGRLELPSLPCPWNEDLKYCPGSTTEAGDSNAEQKVDLSLRDNCVDLGFTVTDKEACDPYIFLPCPFDDIHFFCASPEAKTPTFTPGTSIPGSGVGNSGGTVNYSGITAGSGTSAAVTGFNRP